MITIFRLSVSPIMADRTDVGERVTRMTHLLKRGDGSEVKIVASAFFGAGLHRSVGVSVFQRAGPNNDWRLCNDRPHPDWRTMSVDEYIKHGRSEMLRTVSIGEILRATSAIGRPMAEFPQGKDVDDDESPRQLFERLG